MESNFSENVQNIIRYSREEALRLGHDYIGTEHILLGIIHLKESVACEILLKLDVNFEKLKVAIENAVRTGTKTLSTGKIPITRQAEKVLKISQIESRIYKIDVIDTEHILLSLLRDQDNVATQILHQFNVTYENARNTYNEILKHKKLNDATNTESSKPLANNANATTEKEGKDKKSSTFAPVSAHIHTDCWTLDDKLGYSIYANSLTEFILHTETKAPLTVGILAPWGQGKTTLMRLIQNEIEKKTNRANHSDLNIEQEKSFATLKDLKEWIKEKTSLEFSKLEYPTIWFNAWKYQNCEQLWANLSQAIITQLADQIHSRSDKEKFWFALQKDRLDFEQIRTNIYKTIVEKFLPKLIIWFLIGLVSIIFLAYNWFYLNQSQTSFWLNIPIIITAIGSIVSWFRTKTKTIQQGLEGKYLKYIKQPAYQDKIGFFSQIETDLKSIFKLLVNQEKPAIIFVDDLDRCSPGKVAEAVEAINLFLSGDFPNCFFVVGMDAQVVSASLDAVYKDLSPQMAYVKKSYGTMGWYFMEKFMQLPFIIPNMNDTQQNDLLSSLLRQSRFSAKSGKSKEENNDTDIQAAINEIEKILSSKETSIEQLSEYSTHFQLIRQKSPDKFREFAQRAIKIGSEKFTDDDPEIQSKLVRYAPYINNTPRALKRFANLYRFYRMLQWSREIQGLENSDQDSLAFWLVTMIRWPQLTRWIQWESDIYILDFSSPQKRASQLEYKLTKSKTFANFIESIKKTGLNNTELFNDQLMYDFLREHFKLGFTFTQALTVGVW